MTRRLGLQQDNADYVLVGQHGLLKQVGRSIPCEDAVQPINIGLRQVLESGELQQLLYRRGAVWLRIPELLEEAAFQLVATKFIKKPVLRNPEHTPSKVAGVFTPVEYSRDEMLLWHNENSFEEKWPARIVFGCARQADRGGESILADGREVLKVIDPQLVEEFRSRGIMYVRRSGLGVDKDWGALFDAKSKVEAETVCTRRGIAFRWIEDDILETKVVRKATTNHPITGEECWFNQLPHWHPDCLSSNTRSSLYDLFGSDKIPRDCCFGDGGRIGREIVEHVITAYRNQEIVIGLGAGDLLAVDNIIMAHGRKPYVGNRLMLVSMGD